MNQMSPMLDNATIDALMAARHADPFSVLGLHTVEGQRRVVTLQPSAVSVHVRARREGHPSIEMIRQGANDVWAANLPEDWDASWGYLFDIDWGTHRGTLDDPYRFGFVLGDTDVWLLAEGSHLRPYEKLGAHPCQMGDVAGTAFALWAPNAQRVSVVGNFNCWDGRRHPMRLRRECGVWELFIPGVARGDLYQFEVIGADGALRVKADPYAFAAQLRPGTASRVEGLRPIRPMGFDRPARNALSAPISIYEVHLGSWRKKDGWHWLGYREMAEQLVPYVREQGFTHIELLPVSEFPFDGSWGYQPIGLFAPTARFGSPDDFQALVDACHAAGIGVILDWVPAHFPSDAHGLAQFDGTALYEYADPREGYHQDWNTLIYNFGRVEVRNFLIGNALYWLERFGVDGLRVDAVASMLYRDYSRNQDAWVPNIYGGRENLEAIEFLKRLNAVVGIERAGTIMMAEESTSFPKVSRPTFDDGLGFHFKWNMGWMHDTLGYFSREPVHRQYHQNELTFGLMYAYTENFVLPLSHDEVVHGKGSLIRKMPGDDWQRFANLRALYAWMWAYPGKKLLFMGGEFAQTHEWKADGALDWWLLDHAPHQGVLRLVRDLNAVLSDYAPLHVQDHEPDGFQWVRHHDAEQSVLAFERRDAQGQSVLVVANLTPVPRRGYQLGVSAWGEWRELINTDLEVYGGSGVCQAPRAAWDEPLDDRPYRIALDLPPLATLWLVRCD